MFRTRLIFLVIFILSLSDSLNALRKENMVNFNSFKRPKNKKCEEISITNERGHKVFYTNNKKFIYNESEIYKKHTFCLALAKKQNGEVGYIIFKKKEGQICFDEYANKAKAGSAFFLNTFYGSNKKNLDCEEFKLGLNYYGEDLKYSDLLENINNKIFVLADLEKSENQKSTCICNCLVTLCNCTCNDKILNCTKNMTK